MTHSELISFAWYNIFFNKFKSPCGILATFESNTAQTLEVPDIIGFGNTIDDCVVVECKASRSDFLHDAKKPFRVYPEKGMGKKRIYVVNDGVVRGAHEIPKGWECFVVVDSDTFIELVSHRTEKCVDVDYITAWQKYEFSDIERNWRDEYKTYRNLLAWRDKGYGMKEPEKLHCNLDYPQRFFKDEYDEWRVKNDRTRTDK